MIVADHMASRWAEYVVQRIEDGGEVPERDDFFGDVPVSVAVEPVLQNTHTEFQAGVIVLRRGRLPNEDLKPPDQALLVQYHVVETDWNLRDLLGDKPDQRVRRKSSRAASGGTRGRTKKP